MRVFSARADLVVLIQLGNQVLARAPEVLMARRRIANRALLVALIGLATALGFLMVIRILVTSYLTYPVS